MTQEVEYTPPSFEILIDEDGKMHLRTTGFQGPSCVDERNKLATLLAGAGIDIAIEDVQPTAEYSAGTRAGIRAKK